MIKQALEYLVGLGQVKTLEINGQIYSPTNLVHVKEPKAAVISVYSLTGLVDYVKSQFDQQKHYGEMIHVLTHNEVQLISMIRGDASRETYMIAEALTLKFNFGQFYDVESFIIALQSCFVPNEDSGKILKVVGNIREEAVKQTSDDGISQAVMAKSGIATVEMVSVPNPVILAPYRTFIEIEQPESKFVFRMKQGQNGNGPSCALFEADGGAWRLEAMQRIKLFLEAELDGMGIPIIS